jgi:hypothetical protein
MNRVCSHDSHQKYELLIGPLREVARSKGYSLGVHGSLVFDIDLIACPWTPEAVSAKELAFAIREEAERVNGLAFQTPHESGDWFVEGHPGMKPHGRLCWSFHLGGGPYIDLSVMPRHATLSDEQRVQFGIDFPE